ncbi:Glycerol-3-phosphate dehydrogenase [NAD(P)+] [bioreactor metagenome]|uniref:Glycerol-3-phosphate dehydrogenase [NAD(P)+] n=1 Tax=bioreactor metagenome TaxID=1076179 RepID=A0A645ER87_9ZZZZ
MPENIPVLSVTKGLIEDENKKLISIPEYYEKNINYSDRRSFNAIGGPCTSYELADRHQTIVCYCGKGIKTLEYIRKMLQTEYYHIELSDDIAGTECAVAMKNAYALAVSLGIGLPERTEGKSCIEHYNLQAALFLQSTRELKRIVKLVGGREESLVYGVGDLYVTIFGGRTRKIGTLLGRGMTFMEAMKELSGITLESVSITRNCCRALIDTGTDIECFPLLMHIYDIIENGADVDIPFEKFK